MAVNISSTKRSSWVELTEQDRMLLDLRSFEAEDRTWIPQAYHERSPADLRNTDFVPLYKVLRSASAYGRRGLPSPEVGHEHFTIAGRRASFDGLNWTGPSADVMAECGLARVSDKSAKCYACDVTFKGLAYDVCIWTLHRNLAPNCCHLKRARAHGFKPGNVTRMVRRLFSSSDSESME